MAVRWNSGTYTVTFLKNVGLTETYTFEENRSDVVFDLAGHAIRGCVENGPVLVMDYGYGTDYISIQNGTIENTATGGIAPHRQNNVEERERHRRHDPHLSVCHRRQLHRHLPRRRRLHKDTRSRK